MKLREALCEKGFDMGLTCSVNTVCVFQRMHTPFNTTRMGTYTVSLCVCISLLFCIKLESKGIYRHMNFLQLSNDKIHYVLPVLNHRFCKKSRFFGSKKENEKH